MVKEISVRKGSALKTLTPGNAWVRQGNRLAPVVGVFVRRGSSLITIWDYTPTAAHLVREQQDYSSVTLSWSAAANADKYQILRRSGNASQGTAATVVKTMTPTDGAFWSNRTWKVTGLAGNSTYIFTVRAINASVFGEDVYGPESNALKVYTGVTEQRESGNSHHKVQLDKDKPLETVTYYEFQPTKSDTYSKAKIWATRGGGHVGQGTYDDSEVANRNQYGCVDYTGIYNTLASRHGKVDVNGTSKYIADYITITKATIQTIYRVAKTGGPTTPTLRYWIGQFLIGNDMVPKPLAGSDHERVGPRVGASTGSFDLPAGWADHWARPPSTRIYQGLIFYRGDGEHYALLAGAGDKDYPNSFDLFLTYEWDFVTRTAKAYTTTAYSWPA